MSCSQCGKALSDCSCDSYGDLLSALLGPGTEPVGAAVAPPVVSPPVVSPPVTHAPPAPAPPLTPAAPVAAAPPAPASPQATLPAGEAWWDPPSAPVGRIPDATVSFAPAPAAPALAAQPAPAAQAAPPPAPTTYNPGISYPSLTSQSPAAPPAPPLPSPPPPPDYTLSPPAQPAYAAPAPPPTYPPALPGDLFIGKPAPARRFSARTLVGGAAVALAVLAAAGWFLFLHHPSPYPAKWDPRVAPIASFVEDQRGLAFTHPVKVQYLSDGPFRRRIGDMNTAPTKAETAHLNDASAELRALGLAEGTVDLAAASQQVESSRVVGLYVRHDKVIYVRGSALTPDVRVTLAHELTHALQDQHGDLARLGKDPKLDSVHLSLVEGDAVVVENAYAKQMSPADRDAYAKADSAISSNADKSDANVPAVLEHAMAFPYVFGPTFVDALRAAGGTPAIDAAFARPPASELEILHPEAYLATFKPSTLPEPALAKGQTRLWSDDFGVESMTEVLGQRLGYAAATTALQGWKGDSAVIYRTGGRVCVAVDTAFDGPATAGGFQSVATQWAKTIPGATVSRDGLVVELRSCDPGAAFRGPAAPTPSAFDVLSARSAFLDQVVQAGNIPVAEAVCRVDSIVSQLGPAGTTALVAEPDPTAVQNKLAAVVPAAVAACQTKQP